MDQPQPIAPPTEKREIGPLQYTCAGKFTTTLAVTCHVWECGVSTCVFRAAQIVVSTTRSDHKNPSSAKSVAIESCTREERSDVCGHLPCWVLTVREVPLSSRLGS